MTASTETGLIKAMAWSGVFLLASLAASYALMGLWFIFVVFFGWMVVKCSKLLTLSKPWKCSGAAPA
jgi:hypothetical protein